MRLVVVGCEDCAFNFDDFRCNAAKALGLKQSNMSEHARSFGLPEVSSYPTWCPLKSGAISVSLEGSCTCTPVVRGLTAEATETIGRALDPHCPTHGNHPPQAA